MELNERIRNLRMSKLFTQKELGIMVGVSETSVKCWESGTKSPSMQKIISLSKALDVSTDYLLGVSEPPSDNFNMLLSDEKTLIENYRILDKHGKIVVDTVCVLEKKRVLGFNYNENYEQEIGGRRTNIRKIPKYITPIAAGYSVPIDEDEFEMIEIDSSVSADTDFAVQISGNSMFPYIEDGDVVFVKRTNVIDVGDVGIFCVDGAMYCKQYHIDNFGNLTLVSANPELKNSNVRLTADSGSSIICYGKVLLERKIPFPKYFISHGKVQGLMVSK